MFAASWLRPFRHRCFGRLAQSTPRKSSRPSVRPYLELLEDRLAPSADSVLVVASAASTPFSELPQSVPLTAQVTDTTTSSTTVNEGKVKFTVVNSGGKTVGTAATGTVNSSGMATANYGLPAFTLIGSYTIDVTYTDSAGKFTDNGTDTSSTLKVTPAATTISASAATASFSTGAQDVTLSAFVTSKGTPVNEGQVQFTLVNSSGQTIGSAAADTLTTSGSGLASVEYGLPAAAPVGIYTIEASYSDPAGNFASSSDNTQSLNLNAASATKVGLTTINIVPDPLNSTAQLTLTARVSNPSGAVSEGVVTFTLAGVSGHSNVVNGAASVQLTVPLSNLVNSVNVALSYHDTAADAGFADDSTVEMIAGNPFNSLMPTELSFAANGGEQITVRVANQSLFSFFYAPTGLLTQINVSSLSLPVTYNNESGNVLVAIDGVPWQVNFFNANGQFQGLTTVVLNNDGTAGLLLYDANGHVIGAAPS
jgi:hypothetical protein